VGSEMVIILDATTNERDAGRLEAIYDGAKWGWMDLTHKQDQLILVFVLN